MWITLQPLTGGSLVFWACRRFWLSENHFVFGLELTAWKMLIDSNQKDVFVQIHLMWDPSTMVPWAWGGDPRGCATLWRTGENCDTPRLGQFELFCHAWFSTNKPRLRKSKISDSATVSIHCNFQTENCPEKCVLFLRPRLSSKCFFLNSLQQFTKQETSKMTGELLQSKK